MRRLGLVVAVSLAGFVAALAAFDDVVPRTCVVDAPAAGASYQARLEPPVRVDETSHVLEVTRGAQPVTGARVCLRLASVDRPGSTVESGSRDLGDGRYAVSLAFDRTGVWEGTVQVVGGAGPAAVPVRVEVVR